MDMNGDVGVWTDKVPNQSPALIVVSAILLSTTTIVFIFMQAWRWNQDQRGWDDVMVTLAYVVSVLQSAFGIHAAHCGFGKPMVDIMPTLEEALFYFYLYQICHKLLGGLTKLTFCALYLRIFTVKRLHMLIWIIAGTVIAGSAAFALTTIFQCVPVKRAWNHQIPGHCINNSALWYTYAAFNIFFDIVVYVMPIPMLSTLELARGQKTGLISVFALGAFVIAASIVRLVMLRSSVATTDFTWGAEASIWTEVETNTAVICCCMPALRVPLITLWNAMRGKTSALAPTSEARGGRTDECTWSWSGRSWTHARDSPDSSHQSYSEEKADVSPANALQPGDTCYERVQEKQCRGRHLDKDWDEYEDIPDCLKATQDSSPKRGFGESHEGTEIYFTTHDANRKEANCDCD